MTPDTSATRPPDDLPAFPDTGRIAAIDFGTVRIGIAISDPDRILASPVEVYQVHGPAKDARYFKELARQERICGWVVGLPIHCDGEESQKSKEARTFAKWLYEETILPIRMFDERFSTVAAKERLSTSRLSRHKKKQKLDAVAALVLLESFLESCRYHQVIAGQSIWDANQGNDSLES